jgi:hypothetical protein
MLTGIPLLIQRLITVGVFRLFRLVFTAVQSLVWKLNGTSRQISDARLPENYERCAQVLNVLLCHKFCPMQNASESDFLCTHNRFESPQYIIDNDHISLLTITDEHAIFCEPENGITFINPRPGSDIFSIYWRIESVLAK